MKRFGGNLEGKSIIIQGLGNVGYHAAKFRKKKMEPKSLRLSKEMVLSLMNLVFPLKKFRLTKENGKVEGFPMLSLNRMARKY